MPTEKLSEKDLKRELNDLQARFPKLNDKQIFIAWFLRASITADEQTAVAALCGGARDKDVDAVVIDDHSRTVFVVQGKYRNKLMEKSEKRPDVKSFAELGPDLSGDDANFVILSKKLSPEVHDRLVKARDKIRKYQYRVRLVYVTTGKASASLKDEAERIVRTAEGDARFEFFDGKRVLGMLDYYLRDVAPPVSSLDLEMELGNGVEIKGIFHRYDSKLDIEAWVFSMTGRAVAEMYKEAGTRLFALNIRGYQGDTEINEGMEETLGKEPEYFWYYNNGLTIVCDNAQKISSHGRDILRVSSPQVINGQQTTRTLAKDTNNAKASVTVRVIRIPHDMDANSDTFDTLVSQIVKSTNWQNYIVPSDLISNDRRQIEIHRHLKNMGYWYVRKRQSRGEAKREAGGQQFRLIFKTELAQAVAGCDLDPQVVRSGKERLFEKPLYGTVFPTSDPYFYLTRFWLAESVSYAARGYPERSYAKWLVLNFMWSNVRSLVNSKSDAERFRKHWEQGSKAMYYLWQANNVVYNAALRFYRLKRGKGATATDVSNFFKRRNLHREFAKFWTGSRNSYRPAFKRAIQKFESKLSEDLDA